MSSEPALYSWPPTAVVFDCDGLLMDPEPCWTVADMYLRACELLGVAPADTPAFEGLGDRPAVRAGRWGTGRRGADAAQAGVGAPAAPAGGGEWLAAGRAGRRV